MLSRQANPRSGKVDEYVCINASATYLECDNVLWRCQAVWSRSSFGAVCSSDSINRGAADKWRRSYSESVPAVYGLFWEEEAGETQIVLFREYCSLSSIFSVAVKEAVRSVIFLTQTNKHKRHKLCRSHVTMRVTHFWLLTGTWMRNELLVNQ